MRNLILSEDVVDHIAHLCRLEITPGERTVFASQLCRILDYVNMLQDLDTERIEATFQVQPRFNYFREDTVTPSMPLSDVLSNAPEVEGDYIKMPRIIETEE